MAIGSDHPKQIHPVAGVKLAAIESGIRYPDRLDLVVVELCDEANVVGVTTQNAFCAAPVHIVRENLHTAAAKYFLINTGNANAGTGAQGKTDAQTCCNELASLTGVDPSRVLPFSTGVIGELLPVDNITKGIPQALKALSDANWEQAAKGILTTDTRPKLASRQIEIGGSLVTISGFAKGSGMIKPNMATMLAYVFTDLHVSKNDLQTLLSTCVETSFNRITVDGDTSTNDCCMLTATGRSETGLQSKADYKLFLLQLQEVFVELATGLIKDAEGASKFITIDVAGGKSSDECLKVAYCVAESPLIKTAFFASDPNWGRILAAIGRAGVENLDIESVKIYLGDVCLVSEGAVDVSYTESAGQQEMNKEEIVVRIDLGRGQTSEVVWTSDLSSEYVRINADYRS